MSCRRLALGTAQFGLTYGVANVSGQIGHGDARAILRSATEIGITTLDTAIAYGESEARLGELGVTDWRVVSKLPAIPAHCTDIGAWVREAVYGSLERLRIPRLYGLLLHGPLQLLEERGGTLYKALAELKAEGKVEKIGVSIYDPQELDALWPHFCADIVQAPFNVFDRRIATSGWLARLHNAGTEIHVRSVFLQGLLLMAPERLPSTFVRWQKLWNRWHCWLAEQQLTPLQACLGFALSWPEIDHVVVGVDSLSQLREIVATVATPAVVPPADLMSDDLELLNPSRWSV